MGVVVIVLGRFLGLVIEGGISLFKWRFGFFVLWFVVISLGGFLFILGL